MEAGVQVCGQNLVLVLWGKTLGKSPSSHLSLLASPSWGGGQILKVLPTQHIKEGGIAIEDRSTDSKHTDSKSSWFLLLPAGQVT